MPVFSFMRSLFITSIFFMMIELERNAVLELKCVALSSKSYSCPRKVTEMLSSVSSISTCTSSIDLVLIVPSDSSLMHPQILRKCWLVSDFGSPIEALNYLSMFL
jgi:hypothetical protein